MKNKLRTIVEDNSTTSGRAFDCFIQCLIFLSILSFSIGTLPNKNEFVKNTLFITERLCVVLFSIEYLLRIFVAKHPLKYIFSFYGIIDLLAILPFYIRTFADLRILRAFRIFRIFQTLKLIRYNKALHRFRTAANIVKEEMILFFTATAILIFLSASGIYFFENAAQPESFSSIFHSLWWAIITLTTVGYGDIVPITTGGRIFTCFMLIIGVGVVTVPAGLVATALTKARSMEEE